MSEPAYAETPVEAYLALEAASTPGHARHEFWDGRIRAMGGASMRHNQLVLGIGSELRTKLSNGPCRALVSDMRVRLSAHRYVYPDVVVACPPEVDAQQRPETLTNPRVVFEVLSPSTAAVDRGDKLEAYRAIESLTDYVIVDPDREVPGISAKHWAQPTSRASRQLMSSTSTTLVRCWRFSAHRITKAPAMKAMATGTGLNSIALM